MTAVALALVSSLAYGASDYASGRLATRVSPAQVVLVTAFLQSLCVLGLALAGGVPFVAVNLLWGAAGGFVGALALILYYRALTSGPAGIVAPIVSTSAALPVLVSLAFGVVLPPLTLAGLTVVLLGLVILARSSEPSTAALNPPMIRPVRPIWLALIASACFGLAFLLIDTGSDQAPESSLWVLWGVQIGALPMPFIYSALTRQWDELRSTAARSTWRPLAAITVLNLAADASLVFALRDGQVGIVSVLASLAPVVTIGLATLRLRERLTPAQSIGAALTLAGTLWVVATTP